MTTLRVVAQNMRTEPDHTHGRARRQVNAAPKQSTGPKAPRTIRPLGQPEEVVHNSGTLATNQPTPGDEKPPLAATTKWRSDLC